MSPNAQDRRRLPARHAWIAVPALVLLSGLARAQEFRIPAPEAAATLFARARPVLDEALASPGFATTIRFEPISAEKFRQQPDAELAAQLHWQFPTLGPQAQKQALEAARDAFRAVSVAQHSTESSTILLPANSRRLAQWVEYQMPPGKDPVAFRKDFVTLALVHEAARKAVDEHYGLEKRWAACQTRDQCEVLQALAEGRALWITRGVAGRLGLEACFTLLTDRLECVLHRPASPTLDGQVSRADLSEQELYTLCWLSLKERHRLCLIGLSFFDWLEKQGNGAAVDGVFARPPERLTLLEQPAGELHGLAATLDRLQRQPGPLASCRCSLQPWTPAMVREVAEALGAKEQAERVLRSWQDGAALVCAPREHPDAQVAIGVVRLTDTAGARAYLCLSAEFQRKQDELLNTNPNSPQRVGNSWAKTVSLDGADDAVRIGKQLSPAGGGQSEFVTMLLARTGDLVVLFTWRGLNPDLDWASQFLGDLGADIHR